MIATPICYDQFANADEIERLGIGKSIKFTDITEKNLSEALTEVCQVKHCLIQQQLLTFMCLKADYLQSSQMMRYSACPNVLFSLEPFPL